MIVEYMGTRIKFPDYMTADDIAKALSSRPFEKKEPEESEELKILRDIKEALSDKSEFDRLCKHFDI